MSHYNATSKVEENFIDICKKISKHINPLFFLKKYNTYSKEYKNFYEQDLLTLGKLINSAFPNVEYSLVGRTKSKYSFCKKTTKKLNKCFNYDDIEDSKERKKIENNIAHILSFFDNSDNLLAILKDHSICSQTKMDMLISNLSENDRTKFILHLGMSDDIFAHRLIVRSVGTTICGTHYSNNKLYIRDKNGNNILIQPSIKITNPEIISQIKKTLDKKTNDYSRVEIEINGKKEQINLDYIEKNGDKSPKLNKDGSLTLLRDAIEFPDSTIINITPDNLLYVDGHIYIKSDSGLKDINQSVLRKYDEPSVSQGIIRIMSYLENQYSEINSNMFDEYYEMPADRKKNYIKLPKPSGYKSVHATILKKWFNRFKNKYVTKYSQEIQAESLVMDKDKDDPNSPISHNKYKSSADELSKLMVDPAYDLSDIFPEYILITSFNINGHKEIFSHRTDLETSIKHIIPETNYNKLIQERNANIDELDSVGLISDDSNDFFDL